MMTITETILYAIISIGLKIIKEIMLKHQKDNDNVGIRDKLNNTLEMKNFAPEREKISRDKCISGTKF